MPKHSEGCDQVSGFIYEVGYYPRAVPKPGAPVPSIPNTKSFLNVAMQLAKPATNSSNSNVFNGR